MVEPFNPEDRNIVQKRLDEERWSEKLEQEYIHLFEVYEGETTERSYYEKGQILRGIECGKGWRDPVERLLKSLDFHLKNNCYIENPDKSSDKKYIKDPDASIKIFQIKEKFGEARCYIQANSDRLKNLADQEVAKFEARCEYTCQSCGVVGKDMINRRGGWIYCSCENCLNSNTREQLTFDNYLRSNK